MRRRFKPKKWLVILLLLIAAWVVLALSRPLPALRPSYARLAPVTVKSVSLAWPGSGPAAIGAAGYGILATSGSQQPVPMASVAKIVTALAVLKQKPLALNQQGPVITFDATDIGYYQSYASQGGSVAKVVGGEQISEYQALQTMLLPSANNIAESLARWAFGSPEAYVTYANQFVKTLGMTQTTVADASGFSPQTLSTSKDLVNLGLAAMNNRVLAQIVGQSQADVPVAGTIKNTNWLLGSDGFVGIKTGNTDQAGGCYLFASDQTAGGQKITLVGAVLDAPTLTEAVNGGKTLADSAKSGFINTTVVKAGQAVGFYKPPWGGSIQTVAQKDISVLAWQGSKITPAVTLNNLSAPLSASAQAGGVSVISGQKNLSVPVIIKQAIAKPSVFWRMVHL